MEYEEVKRRQAAAARQGLMAFICGPVENAPSYAHMILERFFPRFGTPGEKAHRQAIAENEAEA